MAIRAQGWRRWFGAMQLEKRPARWGSFPTSDARAALFVRPKGMVRLPTRRTCRAFRRLVSCRRAL